MIKDQFDLNNSLKLSSLVILYCIRLVIKTIMVLDSLAYWGQIMLVIQDGARVFGFSLIRLHLTHLLQRQCLCPHWIYFISWFSCLSPSSAQETPVPPSAGQYSPCSLSSWSLSSPAPQRVAEPRYKSKESGARLLLLGLMIKERKRGAHSVDPAQLPCQPLLPVLGPDYNFGSMEKLSPGGMNRNPMYPVLE